MRIALTIFAFSLGVFLLLTIFFTHAQAYDLIVSIQRNQSHNWVMLLQSLTDAISLVSVGVPALLLLIAQIKHHKTNRRKALMVLICLALSGIGSAAIKNIVQKPRPFVSDSRIKKLSGGGSYSFPSGHATEAATAAIAMIVAWCHWYAISFYFAWALLVIYSRMALGVHDLFDLAGGMVLASGSVLLVLWLNSKIKRAKNEKVM